MTQVCQACGAPNALHESELDVICVECRISDLRWRLSGRLNRSCWDECRDEEDAAELHAYMVADLAALLRYRAEEKS